MKTIKMNQLKSGDIFTEKMQINNREAFLVLRKIKKIGEKNYYECVSRNDNKESKTIIKMKSSDKNVIWLRRIEL